MPAATGTFGPHGAAGPALTVGLTGGVASGKSTVAARFRELGVPVCDADAVAREVVAPGSPVLDAIRAHFGDAVITPQGALDRRRMRALVFGDPAARQRLEQLTHPEIRRRLLAWRDAQRADYCVLEVAILFEAGFDRLVDRTLVVDAPEALQRQRLRARDGIDASLIDGMLAAQMRREQRLALADDVLVNDGDLAALKAAVDALHARYLALARKARAAATQQSG